MKTKIFIVLATVCVFSSCILQPEKSYIYLDNDSDNIVFEVSVKNGNGCFDLYISDG